MPYLSLKDNWNDKLYVLIISWKFVWRPSNIKRFLPSFHLRLAADFQLVRRNVLQVLNRDAVALRNQPHEEMSDNCSWRLLCLELCRHVMRHISTRTFLNAPYLLIRFLRNKKNHEYLSPFMATFLWVTSYYYILRFFSTH